MDLMERLPTMADDALSTLGANAKRLAQSGTAKQKSAAVALLPAITAEQARRRAEKSAAEVERPRRTKKAARTVPASPEP